MFEPRPLLKIISVKIKFEPRDIWIGLYWDKQPGIYSQWWLYLYICILPLLPICITIRGPRKLMLGDPAMIALDRKKQRGQYWH